MLSVPSVEPTRNYMEFPEKQLNKCCNFGHKQILGKKNKPLSSVSASLRRFSKYCKKEDRENVITKLSQDKRFNKLKKISQFLRLLVAIYLVCLTI